MRIRKRHGSPEVACSLLRHQLRLVASLVRCAYGRGMSSPGSREHKDSRWGGVRVLVLALAGGVNIIRNKVLLQEK